MLRAFRFLLLPVFCFGCVIATATVASAQTWTGGAGDGNWSNGANWSGGVPAAGDTATFDASPGTGLFNIPSSLGALVITNGASVSMLELAGAAPTLNLTNATSLSIADNSGLYATQFTFRVKTTGTVTIGTGSTLALIGVLEVGTAGGATQAITATPTSTISVGGLGVGSIQLASSGADDSVVTMTVSGSITFMADNATLDGRTNLFTSLASRRFWKLRTSGNLDSGSHASLTLDLLCVTLAFTGSSTISGGGDSFSAGGAGRPVIGELEVETGATFTMSDGTFSAQTLKLHQITVAGTANLGTNPVALAGSRSNQTESAVTVTGSFTSTGAWTTQDPLGAAQTQTLDGTFTIGGTVSVTAWPLLVGINSDVTLGSTLSISASGAFGANEDTAAFGPARVTYEGNVTISVANGLRLGEGIHSFAADLTASAVANAVQDASAGVTSRPKIHLTGSTTQTIAFEVSTGSPFFIHSVGSSTRVVQTGHMRLVGPLDCRGATGATPFTVFNGTAGTAAIGNDSAPIHSFVTLGDGDIEFATLTVGDVNNGTLGDRNRLEIVGTGGVGVFRADTLDVKGDEADAAAGNEFNNAELVIDNATAEFGTGAATGLFLGNGSTANGGSGARAWIINGSSVSIAASRSLVVGQGGSASASPAGADLILDNATITFGAGASLAINAQAAMLTNGGTLTGTGNWTLTANASTHAIHCHGTTISCSGGTVSASLNGSSIALDSCSISNLPATGLTLAGGTVASLSGNTFTSGTAGSGNSLLTIGGNLGNASPLNCDDNHFDDSTNTGAGGLLVANAFTARLLFRVRSGDNFGTGGASFTATEAEAADNDGSTLTNIRWDDATASTTLALAPQPREATISDGNTRAVLSFTVTGTSGNSTVTDVSVRLDNFERDIALADFQSVSLFRDANNNGVMDTNEQIDIALAPGANDITFTGLSETINQGVSQTWAIGILFASGSRGDFGRLDARLNSLTVSGNHLITGAGQRADSVFVTGPVTSMTLVDGPDVRTTGSPFPTQPVLELRDANGLLVIGDNSTVVEVIIQLGPSGATLLGLLRVTADRGVVRYTNLQFGYAGQYRLRFDNGLGGLIEFSELLYVTGTSLSGGGGGGGGGGGCAAGRDGTGWSPWWAMAMILSLVLIRLRRGD